MKPISSISPFTDVLFKIRPAGTKTDTPLARLEAGQRIQALVVEGGEQNALLEYRRHRFRAATRARLLTGQEVGLEVVRTAPFIQFSLLGQDAPGQIARTVHLLGQGWPLTALKSFVAGMPGSDRESLPSPGQEALQRFLELAGNSSARVRPEDLAFVLHRLGMSRERDLAEGRGQDAAGTVKNGLEEAFLNGRGRSEQDNGLLWQALQRIELLQLLAVRMAEQGGMFFPLPLRMLQDGYLVVHDRAGQGASEESEPSSLKVSLFLDFRSLGPVRVDLLREPDGLYVRIACGTEQGMDRVTAGRGELERALQTLELPLRGLNVVRGALPAGAALLKMATGEEHGVFSAQA
jgi:hypothetical protein